MASNISVPENESIQNDHDYIEVDEMALKVKNFNINRDDRAVTLVIKTNNTRKNNQEQLHADCEDIFSKKGRFVWKIIEGYDIPCIWRVINGVKLQFVSVRMVETLLLSEYLHYLHENIYSCTSVRSYFITDNEASILNQINVHSDFAFGNVIFFARKDYIVHLEDAQEFYTFIDVCYKALLSNDNTGRKKKFGYILVNFETVLPYGMKDDKKYIPLFCFEGETENLQHLTVKLKNWNLAYLKFCCKLQGIINDEFFASDSCTVINFDDIKNFYSNDTIFEEFWPPHIIDIQLPTNENSTYVNPPGVWIRAPLEVVIAENSTTPHTLTESAPVLPTSMPVMNSHQNGRPENQMGSTMLQGSSLMIGAGNIVPPPLLFESVNTTPVIGDTVSYTNAVPLSLCMTTMNNSMTNSNVMSHSNQMQQLYSRNAINSNAVPLSSCMTTMNNSMTNSNVMLHSNQMQQLYSRNAINSNAVPLSSCMTTMNNSMTNSNVMLHSNQMQQLYSRNAINSNAVPLSLCMTTMNNSMTNSNVMSHSNQMQQLYSRNAINSNAVPLSSCMTTMNNSMTNSNVMSHSNQMQQLYSRNAINSNAVPLSLCMTTMNNSMTNSNVMSHSNQMQQLYSQSAINNSQSQQQLIQQQQHRKQQLIISTPQTQPSYSSQYVHGHLTNTQLHNASRNVGPIVATPTTGSIGLTSQPCNPILPTVQGTSLHPRIGLGLTRIPERFWTNGPNIAAYKIEKTRLQGRMIHCINANPYIYTDVLITLQDLVQVLLPSSWTVTSCAKYLNHSKITLFSGNSEQLALLWRCGLISSIDPKGTPMAMLQDIRYWLDSNRLDFRTQMPPPLPRPTCKNSTPNIMQHK